MEIGPSVLRDIYSGVLLREGVKSDNLWTFYISQDYRLGPSGLEVSGGFRETLDEQTST